MTHEEVAQFLTQHPDFFDQHPEVLVNVAIPHPQDGHAVSLVERQSMILRERIKSLELRLADMLRHGEENDAIADRLVHWARALLAQTDPAHLGASGAAERFRAKEQHFSVRPAGNAVHLEYEMMKVAANQMDYQAASALYGRTEDGRAWHILVRFPLPGAASGRPGSSPRRSA